MNLTQIKQRQRTTKYDRILYEQTFVNQFNLTYGFKVTNIKEAIIQFTQKSKGDKRKFDWFRLDDLIGRKRYFSYKYVHEVLYKRYFGKTSKELKVFVKQCADAEFTVMKQSEDVQNVPLEDLKKELVTRVQNQIQENVICLAKYDKQVIRDTLQKFSDEIKIFAPSPKELSSCQEDLQIEFRFFDESDE
ncbi:Hypothetical_protein [Hexamita inflata]|uniref:Hypothetical_protein n=1 Tax=Hexamita inflata TaxID=28002 RepID=A0AA86QRS6_9EUKA|nr:Hypothetical protein HINF_LOCUS52461 [Hexamita inflata]